MNATTQPQRLFGGTVHSALVHAVTQWDIRQSRRKHHNPYALAHYLGAVERVESAVTAGATLRAAIVAAFNDRLRDHVLRAVNEPVATADEIRGTDRASLRAFLRG
jgi:hypothetical protein